VSANSQPSTAAVRKVLFVCAGCGNSIHEDPDEWFAAPDWETVQHAPGCLTHIENDLRAMREGYLACGTYADGYWAALNYARDADRVQAIADLVAALNATPSVDLATQVGTALREFLHSLANGLSAATDRYSRASFSNDIKRVQGLCDLLASVVPTA
jgi:hypothetical protein